MTEPRNKEIQDLLSGRSQGFVTEPRCGICRSPLRNRIDRLAAAGFGETPIADEIMGLDPNLSTKRDTLRKQIGRHVDKHLKIKDAAVRKILEERARQAGIVLDEYHGQMVSDQALLDLMIRQATDQITAENARVHYKDALKAVEIKKEIEASRFSEQLEVMERQLWSISQALKEICPEELYPRIVQKARELFDSNPIEQTLAIKKAQEIEATEVKELPA